MFMGSPCSLVIYARVHFLSLHYLAYITLKLLHSYKMLEAKSLQRSLYLAFFLPKHFFKIKIFYKRDIIFSADEQCFFKKELTGFFFVHENMKKSPSKVAYFVEEFFSIA